MTIHNYTPIEIDDKTITSRQVIKRIVTLKHERDSLSLQWEEYDSEDDDAAEPDRTVDDWDSDDEGVELAALEELVEECERFSGWSDGDVLLINDDYFEEWAMDEAHNVSGIDVNTWPFNHIDWTLAVEALQQDYKQVEFRGQTFWVHA